MCLNFVLKVLNNIFFINPIIFFSALDHHMPFTRVLSKSISHCENFFGTLYNIIFIINATRFIYLDRYSCTYVCVCVEWFTGMEEISFSFAFFKRLVWIISFELKWEFLHKISIYPYLISLNIERRNCMRMLCLQCCPKTPFIAEILNKLDYWR